MRRYDAKEIVTFLNAPGGASALLGTVPQNLKGIRPMLALCKGLERYGQQNGDVYSDLAQANGAVVLAEVLHAHYRSTMVVNPALCLLRSVCIAADGNQLSRMLRESDTSTTPNTPAQTLKTVLDFHSKNADITEACCGVMTVLARGLDAAARRHLLSLDLLPTVVAAVHTNFKRAAPIVACIHLLMALSDCGEYFLQHPPTIRVVVQLLWSYRLYPLVVRSCCAVLAYMCSTEPGKAAVAAHGAVQAIVRVMHSVPGDPGVQMHASCTLSLLASDSATMQALLLSAGAAPHVLQNLRRFPTDAKLTALSLHILGSLACLPAARPVVCQPDVLDVVLSLAPLTAAEDGGRAAVLATQGWFLATAGACDATFCAAARAHNAAAAVRAAAGAQAKGILTGPQQEFCRMALQLFTGEAGESGPAPERRPPVLDPDVVLGEPGSSWERGSSGLPPAPTPATETAPPRRVSLLTPGTRRRVEVGIIEREEELLEREQKLELEERELQDRHACIAAEWELLRSREAAVCVRETRLELAQGAHEGESEALQAANTQLARECAGLQQELAGLDGAGAAATDGGTGLAEARALAERERALSAAQAATLAAARRLRARQRALLARLEGAAAPEPGPGPAPDPADLCTDRMAQLTDVLAEVLALDEALAAHGDAASGPVEAASGAVVRTGGVAQGGAWASDAPQRGTEGAGHAHYDASQTGGRGLTQREASEARQSEIVSFLKDAAGHGAEGAAADAMEDAVGHAAGRAAEGAAEAAAGAIAACAAHRPDAARATSGDAVAGGHSPEDGAAASGGVDADVEWHVIEEPPPAGDDSFASHSLGLALMRAHTPPRPGSAPGPAALVGPYHAWPAVLTPVKERGPSLRRTPKTRKLLRRGQRLARASSPPLTTLANVSAGPSLGMAHHSGGGPATLSGDAGNATSCGSPGVSPWMTPERRMGPGGRVRRGVARRENVRELAARSHQPA